MLDATTVVDPVRDQEERDRGHEDDHRQSPRGDSTSNITPPEEHGRGRDRHSRDLCNVIRDRDSHDWIESRCRDREHNEQQQCNKRDYDYYGPYYD
jgi:hypothetical protein